MQSAWYLVCALAILKASGTLGGAVSNGVECGGDSGNTCDTGLTCIVTYDGCGTHGICECGTGKVWDTDKCKTVVAHDGDCSGSDKKCVTGLACDGTNHKCECASGTYDKNHPSLCLATGEGIVGASCGADSDGATGAETNSKCQSGLCEAGTPPKCACAPGKNNVNSYCEQPYLGQTCDTNNDECMPTASTECTSSTCSCKSVTPLALPTPTLVLGCRVDGTKAEKATCSSTDECKGKDLSCVRCGTSDDMQCKKLKPADSGNGVNPTQALSLLSIVSIAISAITLV